VRKNFLHLLRFEFIAGHDRCFHIRWQWSSWIWGLEFNSVINRVNQRTAF
jgi:hypothetical protein